KNQTTSFTLRGAGLDGLRSLALNDVPVTSFTPNADGTALAFTATLPQPGFYTAIATSDGGGARLPPAPFVSDPLGVSAVLSDNPRGFDKISDSGGNTVLLGGSGFAGNLEVHVFEAGQGISPSDANRVTQASLIESGLRFTSPACEPGHQYQI